MMSWEIFRQVLLADLVMVGKLNDTLLNSKRYRHKFELNLMVTGTNAKVCVWCYQINTENCVYLSEKKCVLFQGFVIDRLAPERSRRILRISRIEIKIYKINLRNLKMLANKFYLQQPYSRVSKLNRMVCTSVQEIIINDEEFCTLATATRFNWGHIRW